ncbi:carbohydrate porin [Methyloligella halotolerans]|uniref:carbohydrate porin n=1 Tax=Methyloligella halotolerans TaxID=1177755 RepID=UPI00083DCA05|nr:carbohydrate porin [Methyloligella halotolerans]
MSRRSRRAALAVAVLPVAFWAGDGHAAGCFADHFAVPYAPRLEDGRGALTDRGIAIGGSYTGEVFSNLSGGLGRATTYDGLLTLSVNADLTKLGGWQGLCFHADAFQIHGQSITAEGTGGLAPASNIEADPATRFSEIWLEQSLFQDRVSIRFGQLAADTEFMLTEASGYLLNGTWGWPTIAGFDIPEGGPAYPMAAPGIRLAVRPTDSFEIKIAAFNGLVAEDCSERDAQLCNPHGVDFPIGDPPLVMGEMAFRYDIANGLPGEVKLGGWHHADTFSDLRFDAGGNPIAVSGLKGATIDGDHAFYAILQQMIWQPAGAKDEQGVTLFGRVMGGPEDRNFIELYTEAGIILTGLMPSRPDDAIAFGYERTGISDAAQAFDIDSGALIGRSYEALAELTYTLALRDSWTLQTTLQYLWRPGGGYTDPGSDKLLKDSTVIGTRSVWRF